MSVVKLEIFRLKTDVVSAHNSKECHNQLNYVEFDGKYTQFKREGKIQDCKEEQLNEEKFLTSQL